MIDYTEAAEATNDLAITGNFEIIAVPSVASVPSVSDAF
jgi:hypothetical protein